MWPSATRALALLTAFAILDFALCMVQRRGAQLKPKLPHRRIRVSNDSSSESDSLEDLNAESTSDESQIVASNIEKSFVNRRTFSCPRVKPFLITGQTTADLSPEDIHIVAAMGDSIATGKGLWPGTDIGFRGAAFPIGGDANIDGLVTIPNILLEFTVNVSGVSHGMGTREQLPDHQFNCAEDGAKSADMPEQANELVRRVLKYHKRDELQNNWVMIVVTIGTEELCAGCGLPNYESLHQSLVILRRNIPRAFVVLLGPVHVSFSHILTYNLLRDYCECLHSSSTDAVRQLRRGWADAFFRLQSEFNSLEYPTFGLLSIPSLTIASRDPKSLFVREEPLLNRKGHTYAAKWLWNRLITGPEYNLSGVVLSEDAYFCPSLGCPYFRTVANRHRCRMMTFEEAAAAAATSSSTSESTLQGSSRRREALRQHILLVVAVIVVSALLSVLIFGTIFYRHGRKTSKSRFESVPGV